MRRLAVATVGWAVLFGLWLLLVDTLERPELLAGAGAAGLGLAAGALVWRDIGARIRLADLRLLARLPLDAARDTVLVSATLVAHLSGRRRACGSFSTVPLPREATGPGARAVGRRMLEVVRVSFPPNSFVVGIDASTMTVHRLVGRADR